MTFLQWMLLTSGTVAIVAYTIWWYRTREEPVPGRGWALALRASALTLLLLIIVNPAWPGRGSRQPVSTALLDVSLSMTRALSDGGFTLWDAARDSLDESGVFLFGGAEPVYVSIDSLPPEPTALESRLLPAVRAAALSGVERALVLTDAELSDAALALAEARRLGLGLRIRTLAPDYASYGIARLRAPEWAQVGDSVNVELELVAARADRDSVRLELVDEAGEVVAATRVSAPRAGRFATARLGFTVDASPGEQRYEARIADAGPDLERRDDSRPFYMNVGEETRGPLLISLRPEWEPSFLVPNLDRLSDAPVSAYYLVDDSLVSLDGDLRRTSVEVALSRARVAPLLVIHGYGADSPPWARELVNAASRVLIFSAGVRPFEIDAIDVRIQSPRAGDWYVTEDLPRSPLVLDLVGISLTALPPLTSVRPVLADRSWSPLSLKRLRRGDAVPALVAGSSAGRRWAVASADGYWRWASRPGAGRQLYRALWTAVGGWLLEGLGAGEPGGAPERRVVERGEPLRWRVPVSADSLRLEILAVDSVFYEARLVENDSVAVQLPPGRYRYLARVFTSSGIDSSSGAVEVEAFSRELLPRAGAELAAVTGTGSLEGRGEERAPRRLATLGWPYLVLLAFLAAEWILRRRIGLL